MKISISINSLLSDWKAITIQIRMPSWTKEKPRLKIWSRSQTSTKTESRSAYLIPALLAKRNLTRENTFLKKPVNIMRPVFQNSFIRLRRHSTILSMISLKGMRSILGRWQSPIRIESTIIMETYAEHIQKNRGKLKI